MNYQGLWWGGLAESGWGINFAHQDTVIFATWFTYDLNGNPWWLTMSANKTVGEVYSGQLVQTSGAPFFRARSITLQTFCALVSESEPPNTVKSCAKT